jgi:hypothetical protein
MEDFSRCIAEISHIRQCLRLSTQGARRKTRSVITNTFEISSSSLQDTHQEYKGESKSDNSSDDSSDDESKTTRLVDDGK